MRRHVGMSFVLLLAATTAHAQATKKPTKVVKPARNDTSMAALVLRDSLKRVKMAKLPHDSSKIAAFYASDEPFALTLTTNIKRIRGDKDATAPYRPATVSYADSGGKTVTVPARIRTRGIW